MKCKRCGQCCYLIVPGTIFSGPKPTDIPCQYLIIHNGKTTCSIYKKRLGSEVMKGNSKIKCSDRKNTPFDYWGCPYNTDKPMVKNHKLI